MSFAKPNKAIILSSSTTYAYIHHPPSSPSKATILFLHGFPSTSYEWRNQIPYFASLGYGILAPDLLGYGGSSKPTSPSSYIGATMAGDIISIMDHENITTPVVGIGHDWGTYPLSRLAIYYPERFEKYVFVSVAFRPPGVVMDVHAINAATEKELGYPMCEYWNFLTEEGTAKLLGDHWESWFNVVYSHTAEMWKTSLAFPGGLKTFVSSDQRIPSASFITPEDKAHHHASFGDDYAACLAWYHRGITNLGVADEKALLEKGEIVTTLSQDTLLVVGLKDAIAPPQKGKAAMAMTVEEGKLKIVDVDAGHWIMLERPDELNKAMEKFIATGD